MTRIRALLALSTAAMSMVSVAEDGADTLVSRIYINGGTTLYCQAPFTTNDRGVRVDAIYGSHLLLRHFNCITARQCDPAQRRNRPPRQSVR